MYVIVLLAEDVASLRAATELLATVLSDWGMTVSKMINLHWYAAKWLCRFVHVISSALSLACDSHTNDAMWHGSAFINKDLCNIMMQIGCTSSCICDCCTRLQHNLLWIPYSGSAFLNTSS